MALVTKTSITTVLDNRKTNKIDTGIVWTKSKPPVADIASWFENTNTTTASLTASDLITADDVINSISTFITKFANYRQVQYVQQYTKVHTTTKGRPTGTTELITESDITNKGILSQAGATAGDVTYKPSIKANKSYLTASGEINYDDMISCIDNIMAKWTNNFNSVVTLTYNRGQEYWPNHSERSRR